MLNDLVAELGRIEAVVIGASAGAVDVLTTLLPAVPAALAVPVIIVVHLPAQQPSLLVDLFAKRCVVPVREPLDKQPIEPGVWFAPPAYHLLVETDRSFALSVDEAVNFSRPSIDVLFESAALAYGRSLLGVVLTGASKDGSQGALAVRESGGLVLVQDPASAEARLMPNGVLELLTPDLVAAPPDLARLFQHLPTEVRP
jgi:two-component system chemotaxis response regulator CheB